MCILIFKNCDILTQITKPGGLTFTLGKLVIFEL